MAQLNQQEILASLHAMQEQWKLMMEACDGMVAEAVRHGFTEEQARAIVAHTLTARPMREDEA
jgi:hypothetical protein